MRVQKDPRLCKISESLSNVLSPFKVTFHNSSTRLKGTVNVQYP